LRPEAVAPAAPVAPDVPVAPASFGEDNGVVGKNFVDRLRSQLTDEQVWQYFRIKHNDKMALVTAGACGLHHRLGQASKLLQLNDAVWCSSHTWFSEWTS
jgi:hypothetical protein